MERQTIPHQHHHRQPQPTTAAERGMPLAVPATMPPAPGTFLPHLAPSRTSWAPTQVVEAHLAGPGSSASFFDFTPGLIEPAHHHYQHHQHHQHQPHYPCYYYQYPHHATGAYAHHYHGHHHHYHHAAAAGGGPSVHGVVPAMVTPSAYHQHHALHSTHQPWPGYQLQHHHFISMPPQQLPTGAMPVGPYVMSVHHWPPPTPAATGTNPMPAAGGGASLGAPTTPIAPCGSQLLLGKQRAESSPSLAAAERSSNHTTAAAVAWVGHQREANGRPSAVSSSAASRGSSPAAFMEAASGPEQRGGPSAEGRRSQSRSQAGATSSAAAAATSQQRTRRLPVPGPGRSATQLIVNYLDNAASGPELLRIFTAIGPVDSVRIMHDPESGAPLGYGFVYMADEKNARVAVSRLNRYTLRKKRLKVSFANLLRRDRVEHDMAGDQAAVATATAVVAAMSPSGTTSADMTTTGGGGGPSSDDRNKVTPSNSTGADGGRGDDDDATSSSSNKGTSSSTPRGALTPRITR